MRLLFVLTAASILSISAACAQTEWRQLNGPFGAYIADVEFDPRNPDTLVMATNIDGVYRSEDGGLHWKPSNTGLLPEGIGAWDLTRDPVHPDTIYLGTWVSGLYQSDDNGKTWRHIFKAATSPHILGCSVKKAAAASGDVNIACAGASDTVFVRSGNASNFEVRINGMRAPETHWDVKFDVTSDTRLYAIGESAGQFSFYISDDMGNNWRDSSFGLNRSAPISTILQDPSHPSTIYLGTEDGVYKSIDGGATWTPAASGLENKFVRDLDITSSEVVFAATWGGLFRSADQGTTWQRVGQEFSSQMVKTIDIDPSNSSRMIAGVWGAAYVSSDGGNTWTVSEDGLPQAAIVAENTLAIDPRSNGQVIYAGTYGGGIAKSTDGGQTFLYINNGVSMGNSQGLFMDPSNPDVLLYATRGGDVLYRTEDGGQHWLPSATGLPRVLIYSAEFSPDDSSILYLTSTAGIYKSEDGGKTWLNRSEGLPDLSVRSVAISRSDNNHLYASTSTHGLYESADSGMQWTPSSLAPNVQDGRAILLSDDSSRLLISTPSGVLAAPTDAKSAPEATSLTDEVRHLIADSGVPGRIFASGWTIGIQESLDQGISWQPLTLGLKAPFPMDAMAIDQNRGAARLYVGTGSGVWMRDLK